MFSISLLLTSMQPIEFWTTNPFTKKNLHRNAFHFESRNCFPCEWWLQHICHMRQFPIDNDNIPGSQYLSFVIQILSDLQSFASGSGWYSWWDLDWYPRGSTGAAFHVNGDDASSVFWVKYHMKCISWNSLVMRAFNGIHIPYLY